MQSVCKLALGPQRASLLRRERYTASWPSKTCFRAGSATLQRDAAQYCNTIPLPHGEVHLWWLDSTEVESPRLLEQYLDLLPPAEKEYVAEGASEAVKKERLLARTLVRSVLKRYCRGEIASQELRFECSPSGKPWLVSEEGVDEQGDKLHFNLTHTERLLGVAVSRGGLVGLDAESSSRLTKFNPVDLARRRFSTREFAVLTGFENLAEQTRLFIRLWCLKEAYVKATGRGILAPPGLRAFTFELLLNIKVRPSRFRPPSNEEESKLTPGGKGPVTPSQEETGTSGFSWRDDRQETGREAEVWNADSRVPFSLQFWPPDVDEMGWETWLMELCGGHTAALVVESGGRAGSREPGEVAPKAQLRCFKTVPLVSEERADKAYCRVIGYGRAL